MATAQTIVNSAATIANIRPMGGTLSSAISNDGLEALNDYFESLKNEGIDFGLSALTLSSEVYVDDSDLMAIKYGLALLIMERINRSTPAHVDRRAAELKQKLQTKYIDIQELKIPTALRSSYTYDVDNN